MRTCVVSRRRGEQSEFLRLVLSSAGEVCVDYRARLPGRGAWVSPEREAVEHLEKRPKVLSRAFKQQVNCQGLLDKVRAANLLAIKDCLSLATRSGVLAGGAQQVHDVLVTGEAVAVVVASDASRRAVTEIRKHAGTLPIHSLPLNRAQLGALVGKGTRAALVIRPGKVGRRLLWELDRLEALR